MNSRTVLTMSGSPTAESAPIAVNRRTLLSGAGLAVTAASALGFVTPAEAFNATPAENAPRYKESEHVKTFYRVVGR
jgi:hypothetical protein